MDANVEAEGGVPRPMPEYRVTVRHGDRPVRYHTFSVVSDDIASALRMAADQITDGIRETGDLVELRRTADPDARSYLE